MSAPPALGRAATALQAELDRIAAEIQQGMSLVGQGQMVKLTGIDTRIAAACEAAQALPPAQAQAMVERLNHLVALLDRLAAELVHRFANLPADLDSDSASRAAAAAGAYAKGSSGRP